MFLFRANKNIIDNTVYIIASPLCFDWNNNEIDIISAMIIEIM